MLTSLLTLQAIYISQGQGNQLSQVNPFTPPLRSRKESNESLLGWSQRAGLCQSTSLKKKWSSSTVFVGTALRNSLLSIRCSGARARPWRAGCWGAVTQAHPKPTDEGWRFRPSAAFLHPRLCHLQVGRPPRPSPGPRLWCCGGRSRQRLSHVPAPGTRRREQEPGGPFPRAGFPGAARSPSGSSRQHRCFLSRLLLASSRAAVLSTSEGTFQRKVKLVKIKIIEHILFYQRDCLWLANRHEML